MLATNCHWPNGKRNQPSMNMNICSATSYHRTYCTGLSSKMLGELFNSCDVSILICSYVYHSMERENFSRIFYF